MKTGVKILFQGDSVTDCGRGRDIPVANSALGGGYVQMIAGRLLCDHPERNYEIYNRGISGHRVVDLYARWKIDALNMSPDVISILIGVNDTWHEHPNRNGVEVPRYAKVYREMLAWTKESLPNAKLVLCEPFVLHVGAVGEAWLPEMAQRRDVVKSLAAEFKTVLVPFQDVFDAAAKKAAPEHWLGDGVHPTYAGHTLMADAWIKATSGLLD